MYPQVPVGPPDYFTGSGTLCDGMVAELNALQGGEDAALWAFRSLPDKNRLTAADAQRLEEAFQTKLGRCRSRAGFGTATTSGTSPSILA